MGKLDGARNFTNKLWNAARFVLGAQPELPVAPSGEPTLPERWIRSRLAEATERATRQIDELELSGYAGAIHEFAWSDYCDWYLEAVKVDLRRPAATDGDRARAWATAAETLASLLRLLHPVIPFVTEEIWSALHEAAPQATGGEPLLISAAWPLPGARDRSAEADMATLTELVRAVRNLRTESGVAAATWLPLTVVPADDAAHATIEGGVAYLEALARVRPIELRDTGDDRGRQMGVASTPAAAAWAGSDPAADERTSAARSESEAHLRRGIARLRTLLSGEFTERAPAEVVQRERNRMADLEAELRHLVGD
jgi:valyl-tRNA synthetase